MDSKKETDLKKKSVQQESKNYLGQNSRVERFIAFQVKFAFVWNLA